MNDKKLLMNQMPKSIAVIQKRLRQNIATA